jgi:putative FmdB family regulatory protein
MPIYEYRCAQCGHTEEHLQKVSDPAPENCCACDKKHTLEKVVSHTSFQLKGDGWYKDLYSSKKNGSDQKASGDSKSAAPTACGTQTGVCGNGKCAVQ